MQPYEMDRWKQKLRNSSMDILKDIQKLLACTQEGDTQKISIISSDIVANGRELIDTVSEQVSERTCAGLQVLQTMAETKKSIIETMNACEELTKDPSLENKRKIQCECKNVASNIKKINLDVNELKSSDFIREDSEMEDDFLGKVKEAYRKSLDFLDKIQASSSNKDQSLLVSSARSLSHECTLLLQYARRFNLCELGENAKIRVMDVIYTAKEFFQSEKANLLDVKHALDRARDALEMLVLQFEKIAFGRIDGTSNRCRSGNDGESGLSISRSDSKDYNHNNSINENSNNNNSNNNRIVDSDGENNTLKASNNGIGNSVTNNNANKFNVGGGVNNSSNNINGPPISPHFNDFNDPQTASKQLKQELSSRDPEKVFKLLEKIGEGASGFVYRAQNRETKRVVAVKIMKVRSTNIAGTLKEIRIMKDLKSSYTLKYYGCYYKDDVVWIIMEYCDGGSLQDIIDEHESRDFCLKESQIKQILIQVLKSLEYLHNMKKIHRDIKAGNIMLNSSGFVKLADFGISAQLVGDEKRTTTIGSSYWMAPETLKGGGYDIKADIWSLGITLLEMAEGIPPLINEQPHKAVMRIVNDPPPRLEKPYMWSKEFNDFIERCLIKEPDLRPSSTELQSHPFVAGVTECNEVIELVAQRIKNQMKRDKKRKSKSAEVEDELNLNIWIEDIKEFRQLLLPGHATSEDVCRRCSEILNSSFNPDYSLWIVIQESNGKVKQKRLGSYDLPSKVLNMLSKKSKKLKFKFVYRANDE